ncbi:hypothetical protein ACWTU6_27475 [Mesorhizobium sp. BHbsci]
MSLYEDLKRDLAELEARCQTKEDRKSLASIKRTLAIMERDQERLRAKLDKLQARDG